MPDLPAAGPCPDPARQRADGRRRLPDLVAGRGRERRGRADSIQRRDRPRGTRDRGLRRRAGDPGPARHRLHARPLGLHPGRAVGLPALGLVAAAALAYRIWELWSVGFLRCRNGRRDWPPRRSGSAWSCTGRAGGSAPGARPSERPGRSSRADQDPAHDDRQQEAAQDQHRTQVRPVVARRAAGRRCVAGHVAILPHQQDGRVPGADLGHVAT